MKNYIVCIVFVLVGFQSQGQISRQDVLPLFSHLGKEEFKQSYQLAGRLLRKFDIWIMRLHIGEAVLTKL